MGHFQDLVLGGKKQNRERTKKEERGEVHVTNIIEHEVKTSHLVIIQVFSVSDSRFTVEVTHITSLFFKERKSPIKITLFQHVVLWEPHRLERKVQGRLL